MMAHKWDSNPAVFSLFQKCVGGHGQLCRNVYWPLWSIIASNLPVTSVWSTVYVWERTKLWDGKRQRQLSFTLPVKTYWIS